MIELPRKSLTNKTFESCSMSFNSIGSIFAKKDLLF